jgi:macrolide transport system ATP-binding/permease protein
MLLTVRAVSHAFGPITVLDSISFALNPGERAGLVGANGVGKSTLLRILAGDEVPESGSVTRAPGVELGFLPQAVLDLAGVTIEDLLQDAVGHLRSLEERMRALEALMAASTAPEAATVLEEYGQVCTRFQDAGGYELDHHIEAVLAGLRLSYLPRTREMRTLSGGEKARVGLAVLLLRAPDVLLPTNHLDMAALEWLESYLAGYGGASLVVSHDRQFLNRAVNRIFEIDEHTHQLRRYEGDYDAYAEAKRGERAKWEEDYERQQEEIKELRRRVRTTGRQVAHDRPPKDSFIAHYKAGAERVATAVARNVRAAEELLRRIEADPIPSPPRPMRFNPRFRGEALQSRTVIAVEGVARRLGDRDVLRNVTGALGPGARVALVGPNGAGKTTLLRILAGLDTPDAGTRRTAPDIEIGYLPQEPSSAHLDRSVLEAYSEGLAGLPEQHIAGLIGHGFFRLEDMDKQVGQLSIGQRRKLEIARIVAQQPNVLLLDEPTNFVSLDVLEAFEAAVLGFAGPVLAVSHDRWFLQRFGGEMWELDRGVLRRHAAGSAIDLHSTWLAQSPPA